MTAVVTEVLEENPHLQPEDGANTVQYVLMLPQNINVSIIIKVILMFLEISKKLNILEH